MNFNINPSLVSRAAISIAAALWYHEDVLNPDKIYCLSRHYTKHEDRVADNAQSLLIPQYLKGNILASIRPVKKQLQHWIKTHGEGILRGVYLYNDFSWTSIGLIDFTKTANNIIRRGCLTSIKAFELACINCSVEHIYELWPLVRNNFNKKFSSKQVTDLWVWHLQNTFQTPNTRHELPSDFYSEGFPLAYFESNVSAFRLFEQQFLEETKDFIKTIMHFQTPLFFNTEPHDLLFFLSYMDATQQDKFLKKNPASSLTFFLKWPLWHFFLQLADKLWECCTKDDFYEVIAVLTEKIRLRKNEAVIYRNLFVGFWMRSPMELRNDYIKTNILYSGAYDEKFVTTFLYDAHAPLYFILEEDKPRAIRALFQKFLSSI